MQEDVRCATDRHTKGSLKYGGLQDAPPLAFQVQGFREEARSALSRENSLGKILNLNCHANSEVFPLARPLWLSASKRFSASMLAVAKRT